MTHRSERQNVHALGTHIYSEVCDMMSMRWERTSIRRPRGVKTRETRLAIWSSVRVPRNGKDSRGRSCLPPALNNPTTATTRW